MAACNCTVSAVESGWFDYTPVIPEQNWFGFVNMLFAMLSGLGSFTQIYAIIKHPAHVAAVSTATWVLSLISNAVSLLYACMLGNFSWTASSAGSIVCDIVIVVLVVVYTIRIERQGGSYDDVLTAPKVLPVLPATEVNHKYDDYERDINPDRGRHTKNHRIHQ